MDKNSKAYKSGEFNDIFEAAEIASMASEDVVEYSKSYARYEADQAAIAYAGEVKYAEGREAGIAEGEAIGMARGIAEGEARSVENTARKLWKAGMDREFIKEITGLDIEDIL